MRDHRDKGVLQLFLTLTVSNIAYIGDRSKKLAGGAALRRIAALHIDLAPIAGFNQSLGHRVRGQRQALKGTVGQAEIDILGVMDGEHLGARPSDRLLAAPARKLFHRFVKGRDPPAIINNHYSVSALFDNRVKALLLAQHSLVESRVRDGDSGLVGKGFEHLMVIA